MGVTTTTRSYHTPQMYITTTPTTSDHDSYRQSTAPINANILSTQFAKILDQTLCNSVIEALGTHSRVGEEFEDQEVNL